MKLGIYQCPSAFLDVQKNLDLMDRVAQSASLQDADMVIFPELFLTGYNIGDEAGALSESVDGPSAQRVSAIAAEYKVSLLYGYIERANGVLYNSARLVDATGIQLANYRKTHLFGDEERRIFEPGDGLALATVAGVKLGILICYDIEFPEIVRALSLQGAKLIAVPTALAGPYYEVPTSIIRSRAYENQVFVAYVDHVGSERELTFIGGSAIVGPDGHDLVRAGEREETLMVAGIDVALYRDSYQQNTYLADRRPELYADVAKSND